MSPLSKYLTEKEIEEYRTAALLRQEKERREISKRRECGLQVAAAAAKLLKDKFGATRVVVFGSVIRESCFTPWSDVDIAAWGILPEKFLSAIGEVKALDSNIAVNLVDMAVCKPSLKAVVEKEGYEL